MLGGSLAWAPSEFSEIKQRYGSFFEIRTRVAFPLFLLSSVSSVLVLRRASPRLRPTPRRQVSLPRFGALGPHRPMFSSGCDCYLPNFYMNLCVSSTSQILISREDITAENDGSNSRAPWANWSRRMPLGRHWNVDRQWNQRCNILLLTCTIILLFLKSTLTAIVQTDVKKLKDAGIQTVAALTMHTRKV